MKSIALQPLIFNALLGTAFSIADNVYVLVFLFLIYGFIFQLFLFLIMCCKVLSVHRNNIQSHRKLFL